jgi:hypothetical protein
VAPINSSAYLTSEIFSLKVNRFSGDLPPSSVFQQVGWRSLVEFMKLFAIIIRFSSIRLSIFRFSRGICFLVVTVYQRIIFTSYSSVALNNLISRCR